LKSLGYTVFQQESEYSYKISSKKNKRTFYGIATQAVQLATEIEEEAELWFLAGNRRSAALLAA
jgi:hypothetical protein